MPKFYFHLRNDIDVDDEEGTDFPDLAAAREHAVANVRSVAAGNVSNGHLDLWHRIEIADETGRIVGTVTFGDAVTVKG